MTAERSPPGPGAAPARPAAAPATPLRRPGQARGAVSEPADPLHYAPSPAHPCLAVCAGAAPAGDTGFGVPSKS